MRRRNERAADALLNFRIGCSKYLKICRQERSVGADVAGLTIRSWSSPLLLVTPSTPTSWQKGSKQFCARLACPWSVYTTYAIPAPPSHSRLGFRPKSLLSSLGMPARLSPWMSTRTYCRTCKSRQLRRSRRFFWDSLLSSRLVECRRKRGKPVPRSFLARWVPFHKAVPDVYGLKSITPYVRHEGMMN